MNNRLRSKINTYVRAHYKPRGLKKIVSWWKSHKSKSALKNKFLNAFSLRDDDYDNDYEDFYDYECDDDIAYKAPKRKVNLKTMLTHRKKTFQEKLFEIIDERGLTGPEVYTNYISRQTYSKIQANRKYRPTKYTAIALCLSLHLNIDEALDLMARAGWTLSPSNKADIVVKACIINGEYNITNIDILLDEHGCDQLIRIR